ncbi:MAG: sigma-70 family RNA polymerase sigma factor [Oligoflexia bacterium]|nr:sigma-70 family RNA polymerase sigma factor [Oligoflexia bacterium]
MYLENYFVPKESYLEAHKLGKLEQECSHQSYLQSNQTEEDLSSKLIDHFRNNKKLLRKIVRELPEDEFRVILMHFWEGKSFSKIASFLQLPETLIKITYAQALVNLRKKLIKRWVGSRKEELFKANNKTEVTE